jgi:hypothetical protein
MYRLFANGKEVDHFNPIPGYWSEKITEQERLLWKGNAKVVAEHWPGLKAEAIEKYLVAWDLDNDNPKRSYPDDKYKPGDCWQLLDFMRRLGLNYPIDDHGKVAGQTYDFKVGDKP